MRITSRAKISLFWREGGLAFSDASQNRGGEAETCVYATASWLGIDPGHGDDWEELLENVRIPRFQVREFFTPDQGKGP